jgi:DDE superfamily endonuclease
VLGRGRWDADATRDVIRSYVVRRLGAADGVLVVDETGFVKKGEHSVGVARQYSGTAGRIENCQIGVFLGYASRRGHALIDRRLYLPEEWTADAERCRQAQVPNDIAFATKPMIARKLRGCATISICSFRPAPPLTWPRQRMPILRAPPPVHATPQLTLSKNSRAIWSCVAFR